MRRDLCILFCGLVAFSTAGQSTASGPVEDAMEIGSRKLAGPQAIDCGRVHLSESPKAATDCALTAFKSHKPFRVRYDLQGTDSGVAMGLVQSPDGKLYATVFDDNMMSGGTTDVSRQSWHKQLCQNPFKVRVARSGRLACSPPPFGWY